MQGLDKATFMIQCVGPININTESPEISTGGYHSEASAPFLHEKLYYDLDLDVIWHKIGSLIPLLKLHQVLQALPVLETGGECPT
jgi:hypothetical protein